ncbi:MAG: TetR/AcrR family transcriptional regulator [Rhodospirillales bacterium]|nr:TetR/AcrR family transcriptional regulator [Acetobacter sp.]
MPRTVHSVPQASPDVYTAKLPGDAATRRATGTRSSGHGGRPSKREVEALELRILDEATRLFAAQGYAATSMEQVISACGAGKDTIYRRYPRKNLLFAAVLDHLQQRALRHLEMAVPAEGLPIEKVRGFARQLLSANLDPDILALRRISYSEMVTFGEAPKPATADDPIMRRFSSLIAEAQLDGSFARGNPDFIADQLLHAVAVKPTLTAMLAPEAFASDEEQTAYFEQAWLLFMNGAAAEARRRN